MYVVNMKVSRQYAQGEYAFKTKKETFAFLEQLNEYEIESIISIEKYTKKGFDSAWYEFFN